MGYADLLCERNERHGARSTECETYHADRRTFEHHATQDFARAGNKSAFPVFAPLSCLNSLRQLFLAALLAPLLLYLQSAQAISPVNVDPLVEKRLQALSKDLRCLVCQNQSLADSNSGLAGDLRNEVREMILQGHSDKEISDFLVTRYGDFVLYKPPLRGTTLLLWLGPAIMLLIGLWVLYRQLLRHRLNNNERADDENPGLKHTG